MKHNRNAPCPCGSGKKYKHCCYLKEGSVSTEVREPEDDFENSVEDILEILEDEIDDEIDDELEKAVEELLENPELWIRGLNSLRNLRLKEKPHIKEYNAIRSLHGEVIDAMTDYYYKGKFKQEVDTSYPIEPDNIREVNILSASFDLSTDVGAKAFFDTVIYKSAPNVNCITEEFINIRRYRKPEKIEFLQSMLNSRLGLFEITKTEAGEGYVYLKEVFTGDEYRITDIGLSGTINKDEFYIYTRIITYHGISFGTGLSMVFVKTDKFIKKHIRQHKKNYDPKGEVQRFTQIYNQFSRDPGKVITIQ